jgi:hypothetical protein
MIFHVAKEQHSAYKKQGKGGKQSLIGGELWTAASGKYS